MKGEFQFTSKGFHTFLHSAGKIYLIVQTIACIGFTEISCFAPTVGANAADTVSAIAENDMKSNFFSIIWLQQRGHREPALSAIRCTASLGLVVKPFPVACFCADPLKSNAIPLSAVLSSIMGHLYTQRVLPALKACL